MPRSIYEKAFVRPTFRPHSAALYPPEAIITATQYRNEWALSEEKYSLDSTALNKDDTISCLLLPFSSFGPRNLIFFPTTTENGSIIYAAAGVDQMPTECLRERPRGWFADIFFFY